MIAAIGWSVAVLAVAACSGKLPETRYYQLAAAGQSTASSAGPVIALEPLATEAAYDDDRIIYRTSPYRLDYYQYHRWSAPPGVMIGNYLEQAFERTGRFRGVVREGDAQTAVVLGGRVVAIEEVDVSRGRWVGRVVVELRMSDARTGAVLWTEQYEEAEPLTVQTPEGLARALSAAMARIVARAAPTIAEIADRHAIAGR